MRKLIKNQMNNEWDREILMEMYLIHVKDVAEDFYVLKFF